MLWGGMRAYEFEWDETTAAFEIVICFRLDLLQVAIDFTDPGSFSFKSGVEQGPLFSFWMERFFSARIGGGVVRVFVDKLFMEKGEISGGVQPVVGSESFVHGVFENVGEFDLEVCLMWDYLKCRIERNRVAHQGKVGVMDPTKDGSFVISIVDLCELCGQPQLILAACAVVIFVALSLGTDVDSGVRVVIEEGLDNVLCCEVPVLSDVRDDEGSEVFRLDIGDDGEDAGHAGGLVQFDGHFEALLSPGAEMISEG